MRSNQSQPGADDEKTGAIETLVLGPKAAQVAESYVLSLFHLYPNVYLHKTTRGAEMIFGALMRSLIRLVRVGDEDRVGLPPNHPMRRFAHAPDKVEHALGLDDSVFWGALPLLSEAEDPVVAKLAVALKDRRLPECIDIRRGVEEGMPRIADEGRPKHRARIKLACSNIVSALKKHMESMAAGAEPVLVDQYSRPPYKRYKFQYAANRILIRAGGTPPVRDMAELSPVIAGAEDYEICRAYVFRDDTAARDMVWNIMRTEMQAKNHGRP